MANRIQHLRGSDSEHNNFTGAKGEISLVTDTTSNKIPTGELRVHDGSTAGGLQIQGKGIAKAWVNFSASANPTIRSQYNVTSVTEDGGAGKYLINVLTGILTNSPNAIVLVINGDLTKHINRNIVSTGAQCATDQIYVSFWDAGVYEPDICSVVIFQ
tara:strand:- start:433 stop:906 length:474 start_codon:yes stop_codon:yes gene_type:complete